MKRVSRVGGKLRRVNLLGHEGGRHFLILLVYLDPFGIYLSVRTPTFAWLAWRYPYIPVVTRFAMYCFRHTSRVKITVGPMFGKWPKVKVATPGHQTRDLYVVPDELRLYARSTPLRGSRR